MELKIYSSDGKLRCTVEPGNNSTQVEEIQAGNVLTLNFTLPERVLLEVNDYTEFLGNRYWLTEKYRPVQKSTVEWEYSVKFLGLENLITRFLVLNTTDGGSEPVFTLTAPAREHVALIVRSINAGFGNTDWKVGSVESGDNIVIDYQGKYCHEALKEVAEKIGTEYWIEGTTVNLCRCEHGESVTLGYQKGLTKIQPDTADNAKVYTRLFPIGSSINIDRSKYGYARLQLPGKVQYVDINTDKYGIIHHYEENAFAGIFPRRTGTVSDVRSEEVTDDDGNPFTVYYFKDPGMSFDPNDYEIGGLVKRVSFQEGSELAGLGSDEDGNYFFECNYDSDTKEFEIITQFNDAGQLPGGMLVPKNGDRYILWNIRMPDEYYLLAEAEFLDAVNEYNRKHALDVSCYKAPTDYIDIEKRGLDLHVGRRIRLESNEYFPENGYKDSRITKITRKVNLPTQMDLEISDALSTGAMDKIKGNIEDVKSYVLQNKGGLPDIIRTGDRTTLTDNNLLSALRVLKEIGRLALSRLKDDEATGLIKFLKGLQTGTYEPGVSGAAVDSKGDAEFGALVTRLKAELAELHVKGDSEFGDFKETISKDPTEDSGAKITHEGDGVFRNLTARINALLESLEVNGDSTFKGRLSSEDFISGFIGGKGWAILKREVLNALGVPETKYTAEFDDIVVRGALRVFTMVISQLLGENDNRVFTGMMEVDHYDPVTGKVYLDTQGGKYYNPFRKDDYIMVQQYNGMPLEENAHYITKHYELIVADAGCGDQGDGENRLDWVTFGNFVSADGRIPADVISKGDTLTRVDNATDPDRKGLIQIITVGTATPYMDIAYGMKTDPEGYLKGRLGNLSGIHHHLFGWLDGFGELLTNLYAVGDFRLRRTGESVDTKIEMLKGMFATRYQGLEHDLTEDDNYLHNASFTETMEGWTADDDGSVITSNGGAFLMNGNAYVTDSKSARIENYDGRNLLHIRKSGIRQSNALIRKPGTHKEYAAQSGDATTESYTEKKDTLYMSVRVLAKSDGTLSIGMSGSTTEPGSLPAPATVALTGSMEWRDLQWEGTWDGKGDFILSYTGECYISLLSLTDRALDDFRKEVSTQIVQTAGNIRLLGTNINGLKGTVTQLGVELDAAEEQIRIYSERYDALNSTVTSMGLRIDAAESKLTLYARQINDLEGVTNSLGIRMDAAEATLDIHAGRYDTLNQKFTDLGVRMDAAEGTLTLYGKRIDKLEGTTTSLGIRMDTAEGSITAHAARITTTEASISALQVTTNSISSAVTGVQGDLATAKSRIETVAGIAASAGDAEVYDQSANPWNSWASGTESKHVGALWHNTNDGHTYRYVGYDNKDTWEDVTNNTDSASYVLQNKDKISTVVASFDSAGNLTNTSGLVTTSYATQIYATKTSVDALGNRVTAAEASIDVNTTQISMKVAKDGVISAINQSAESVTISASKIDFNGMVTMNNSFRVETNGTTHIGGFIVSGTGLTNGPDFSNDAYIIFRNDAHGCFAGIGGNILPATTGARGVARFENHDTDDWWALGTNYAVLVSARGMRDNRALQINGGTVSGMAMHTAIVTNTAYTIKSTDYQVVCINTSDLTLTLPTMQLYDDGHVIRIKRLGSGGVKIKMGYCYTYNGNSSRYTMPCMSYDQNETLTGTNTLTLKSVCDAIELVWCRDISRTVDKTTYYGMWLEYKLPRDW
ncbi:MAG: hypothetical protein NC131_08755 [Roseburia sp.]|nr:hypothetical protein [Roseburia sp.]